MSKNERYAGGVKFDFFPSATFEATPANSTSDQSAQIKARNILRMLMMGWHDNWHSLISKKELKAVFYRRDHQFTQAMRYAFQEGFQHLFTQLQEATLTETQHRQALLFISNCIAYLPFADPTPYESFTIPQWLEGRWQMVEYKVTPIELTPTSGVGKLFLEERDRVFAYGLESFTHLSAEPHLVFMGTTYPAGQGFITTVKTDLKAFQTPGTELYLSGRERITNWLEKQHQRVHSCGASLGGSLSLLLAIDKGDKLSRVDALNPPGLYDSWFKNSLDHWDELAHHPLVTVQKQGHDPVSSFGIWKKDWIVMRVIPQQDKQGPNGGVDHALNYAGFPDTQFLLEDTEEDNKSRRSRNLIMYTFLRSIAYYALVAPFRYLGLPGLRFLYNNWGVLALSAVLLLGAALFAPLPLTGILAIAAIPLLIRLLTNAWEMLKTLSGYNELPIPACHHPALPRNAAMDLYTNNLEATLTYKELGEYYYAKRCLLKNKPYLPAPTENNTRLFNIMGLNKRDILLKSQDSTSHEACITLTATKAKIANIRQTSKLIQQFGFHQPDKLIVALEQNQREYRAGKGAH